MITLSSLSKEQPNSNMLFKPTQMLLGATCTPMFSIFLFQKEPSVLLLFYFILFFDGTFHLVFKWFFGL